MTTYYMQTKNGDVFTTNQQEYHKDCAQLTKKEGEALYKAQALTGLKKIIKPGTTIYTKLESVNSSGMSRRISLFVVLPKTKTAPASIANISHDAALVTGYRLSDKGGIIAQGCGMDMGFALVYALGKALWPKGTPKSHGMRNGKPDKAGGYALKHEWL